MGSKQEMSLQNASWSVLFVLSIAVCVISQTYVSYVKGRRVKRLVAIIFLHCTTLVALISVSQEDQFVSKNNCQSPATLKYSWPLGIDLLSEAFAADRTGTILDFFVTIVKRTGNTFEQIILGARGIDTVDPRNIEAVLSTQFSG